jgi:predicted RND superfamily exporter protein
MVWMLAAMAGLGIPLNFMNIFVTTMILGIGVDYGVHVIHRYREARDQDHAELHRALSETGNAIVVAVLTTVCGFGSLAVSHYPGLRSLGYVAILGASSSALVAITLLPAFLAWIRSRREGAFQPSPQEPGPAGAPPSPGPSAPHPRP